ncbi:MAG: 1-(5-phosphoribosyl)-5-[(5-phosphoribosylamino)methylideneamino]imidazole-4-carboxamide isomerase [Lachnospiraceae bacterium]|jgi:phosphoribosylformimino-5-aminoimidazole carboxamide ribotide isomerase
MRIFPAIDLFEDKVVRLFKGDYEQMTVYSNSPVETAKAFAAAGAEYVHIVDLEGARDGSTPNFATVCRIKKESGLFCEVGGGIRTMSAIEEYISAGIDRVILGTAAVTNSDFLREAVKKYAEKIAVSVDIRDGTVATNGWIEKTALNAFDFCEKLQTLGIRTIICTDISKDGTMMGTNRLLYNKLANRFSFDIIASGGISSLEDIRALARMNLYGAIIGKACYTGAIDLTSAIRLGNAPTSQASDDSPQN